MKEGEATRRRARAATGGHTSLLLTPKINYAPEFLNWRRMTTTASYLSVRVPIRPARKLERKPDISSSSKPKRLQREGERERGVAVATDKRH